MKIKGFTLIEMMVVMSIVVILIGASFIILFQVVQTNNRAQISNELRQTGNQIIETVSREVRRARSVKVVNNVIKTYGDRFCSDTQIQAQFWIDPAKYQLMYQLYLPEPTPEVPVSNLTSEKIVVADCLENCSISSLATCGPGFVVTGVKWGEASPSIDCLQSANVSISLTIQQSILGARSDYCGKLKFKETVGTRNY